MALAAGLTGGIAWVGYYIAAAAISFFAILSMRETRHTGAWAAGAGRSGGTHGGR